MRMAYIVKQKSQENIVVPSEVANFLEQNEVIYEKWEIAKVPEALQGKFLLSDDEKQQILEALKTEIQEISLRRGYEAYDVISLSEHTPNLDQLLQNFKQEHHHSDDEVRFIVSGHGIFVIQGKDGEFFEVFLDPGDLISVPENVRHYFTLQDDRQVTAIRIFVTTDGWVPIYENEAKVSQ